MAAKLVKIKILTSCSGLKFSFRKGSEVEVSQELAKDLVKGGVAQPVKSVKTASTRESKAPRQTRSK